MALILTLPRLATTQQGALAAIPSVWDALPTMGQAICTFSSGLCSEDGCPWRAGWMDAAEAELTARVRHQPGAVHLVLDALRLRADHSVEARSAARGKPLVLSLHGPTGVGKSLLHEALARALYATTDARGRPSGALVLGAVHYRNPKLALEYEEELRARINQHVRRCARPLIVVEELQLMPREALAFLAPMLARPTDSSALEYANATFILASNLGADAVTARAYAAPSRAQLDVDGLQDELLATVDVAAGSTALSATIDVVVPLLPFGRDELRAEARALLAQLRADLAPRFAAGAAVGWDAAVGEALLDKLAWEGDAEAPARQLARYGLQTLATKFNTLVNGPTRRHVDAALKRACGGAERGRLASSVRVALVRRLDSDALGASEGTGGRIVIVDVSGPPPPDGYSAEATRSWWAALGTGDDADAVAPRCVEHRRPTDRP
jgi:hypothetical protein